MTTTIRHRWAPPALGCRWCGYERPVHGQQWVPNRVHIWTEPTRAQIEARIRARLAREAAHRRGTTSAQ